MNTIENAKNELKTKELTFVAMGVNSTWEEADYHTGLLLNKLREDKNSLSGTVAAAHRIGRADALLLCYGGIRESLCRNHKYSCHRSSAGQRH